MKKTAYFALAGIAIAAAACSGNKGTKDAAEAENSIYERLDGDRNVYGLMCEGSNDSVLYLLPPDGSDPVKYSIINAQRRQRIFGNPDTGDKIAVLPNAAKKYVADMVINVEKLKGTWCYTVMPKLRDRKHMSKDMQEAFWGEKSDSMRKANLVPREYGFTLKHRYQAHAIGWVGKTSDQEDEMPVIYPPVPIYREWHLLNGNIVLSRLKKFTMMTEKDDSKGKETEKEELINDTAEIIMLKKDSLVLRFSDRVQGFYRLSNARDANKKTKKSVKDQGNKNTKKVAEEAEKS
jgi:hypothetical protein